MALPRVAECYEPILYALSDGSQHSSAEIQESLKDDFFLKAEECEQRNTDGKNSLFKCRVNTACSNLAKSALIKRISRGTYTISTLGQRMAERNIVIDHELLSAVPSYYNVKKDGEAYPLADMYWTCDPMELIPGDRRKLKTIKYKISISALVSLCKKDTRLFNVINTGLYAYWDGAVVSKLDFTAEKFENNVATAEPIIIFSYLDGSAHGTQPTINLTREGYHRSKAVEKTIEQIKVFPWTDATSFELGDLTKELLEIFPCRFGPALQKIMARIGVSDNDLANILNISDRTIRYWKSKDDQDIELYKLWQICIGLRLPLNVSEQLITSAGRSASNEYVGNETYRIICAISSSFHSNKEINDYCDKCEVAILFPNAS